MILTLRRWFASLFLRPQPVPALARIRTARDLEAERRYFRSLNRR